MMSVKLLTVLHVFVVTCRPVDESADREERVDGPLTSAADLAGCYVVTIFGLKTADCGKQNARSVPTSLDSDLQVLRFEDNRMTVLGDGEFSSYANLQEIYLARNRLELIESTAFRGLYSLQILDLEANQLTAVPATSLQAVATSLRLLSLKNNPIRRLEADSLSRLIRLEEINFEDCWLEYIDPAAFSGLQRLSAVNLVNNELRTLDSGMQSTLPSSLRVLRLYRNPWTCDCRLRWLRRWLVSSGSSDSADATINWDFASNTPTCSAPALIRGVAWRHLTADQFACPSRIVSVSAPGAVSNGTKTGLRAVSGSNATVECVAAGDPEPIITWSRIERDHVLAPPTALVSVRQGSVGEDGEPRIVSVLTLLSVVASSDSGVYSCTAENTAGRAEMTFKLTVDTAPDVSATSAGLWPIDRDVFLGTVLGLLVVVCVIIACVVLIRVRSVARRRRREHSKNMYYIATTGNHVGPSPTSNHRPLTDAGSTNTPTVPDVDDDDDDSKSSEERSYIGDVRTTPGSPSHPLLPNNHQHLPQQPEEQARQGRRKLSETSSKQERVRGVNRNESRSLLGRAGDGELELGERVVDDEMRENDEVSLSEKLSDVEDISDNDTENATTNDDDPTNLRERSSRAVSFGPNMIINTRRCSSSSGERYESSPPDRDLLDSRNVNQRHSDVERARTDQTGTRCDSRDDRLIQRSVNSSPSVDHRPPTSHPTSTPGRRLTTPSPAPSVEYETHSGKRHSSEQRPVGNGSVRRVRSRPLSPHTPSPPALTSWRPSLTTESGSLERSAGSKTRRWLPTPINPVVRRSPGPGRAGGVRSGHQSTPPSREAALAGNHVANCTPMSLAELLAPPFGGTAASGLRQLHQTRSPLNAENFPRKYTAQQVATTNCVFDDDCGTDI